MKKSLSQAVAMATLLGAAASVQAVNVDPNGHGQALLYPLYTVENGNYSVVSVTNTTDKFKAVKVRFLEGANSVEVLDFNLYLSPQDVWTGAVVEDGDGAKLVSTDTSCISAFPNGFPAEGVKFRTTLIDKEGKAKERSRIGHVEVIEMADIDDSYLNSTLATVGGRSVSVRDAIKHKDGAAPVCAAVNAAWNPGGIWKEPNPAGGPGAATYMLQGTGGLYGTGYVINVDRAWSTSYDATALANVYSQQVHNTPGGVFPNLGQADAIAVFQNGAVATTTGPRDKLDAVSAVLMKEEIQNDYVVGAGLNANTEMVVTFPTKHEYVNGMSATQPAHPPFSGSWNGKTLQACEPVSVEYYDREERNLVLEDDQISPAPEREGFELCHETNLVKISDSNNFGGDLVSHDLDFAFSEGWMNMSFVADNASVREIAVTDAGGPVTAVNPKGLPVIGFSTVVIENGVTSSGVLNTYAQGYQHKATVTNEN